MKSSKLVKNWLHILKRRNLFEADLIAKNRIGVLDVVRQIGGLMRIRADRDDAPAKVFVEAQDITARLCVRETIVPGRGVDLNALAIFDGLPEDLGHEVLHLGKRVDARFVVAHQKVEVCQDGIVFKDLHRLQDFFVIRFIVLLLAAAALKVLRPEFLIVDLMHGEQHEVELVLILGKQALIIGHRDGLDAELQPRADDDLVAIGSPHKCQLGKSMSIVPI